MAYKLPELPYSFDALEPYIDAMTMEIHYTKHHAGYVNNLNSAISKYPELEKYDLKDILRNIDSLPEDIRIAVRNNGGGHYNHTLFWEIMKKNGGREPKGELLKAIEKEFGSFSSFWEKFSNVAKTHFGSGWAWLAISRFGKLSVFSTPNQDNPIMIGYIPILGLDLWEHAYYLKYQNRRAEYVDNWFNVINWEKVYENYKNALEMIK
ncbi:MAG: superoxide dismutase [Candidatus Hydrothermales bacterium]